MTIWNNLDNETKVKLAKEASGAICQVAAIIASFAVGKKIEQHYGSNVEDVEEKPKKFWKK